MTESGQPAPDFTLPTDTGEQITLSEQRPAKVVLYFYPKADTSGCTKEANAFSQLLPEFEAAGAKVFGVSKDTVVKLAKFREKHELTVTLLSDAETDICDRYGVWVEKSMYGKKYFGIERATFLIDGDGTVQKIWRKVKVTNHAETVLEHVRAL